MFPNFVKVGLSDLPSVKAALAGVAPGVSHGNKIEALSRGLGFGSYAALRAGMGGESRVLPLSWEDMTAFLAAKGYKADSLKDGRAANWLSKDLDREAPGFHAFDLGLALEPFRAKDPVPPSMEHFAGMLDEVIEHNAESLARHVAEGKEIPARSGYDPRDAACIVRHLTDHPDEMSILYVRCFSNYFPDGQDSPVKVIEVMKQDRSMEETLEGLSLIEERASRHGFVVAAIEFNFEPEFGAATLDRGYASYRGRFGPGAVKAFSEEGERYLAQLLS